MDWFYPLVTGVLVLSALWGVATWAEAHSFKKRLYGLGHIAGRTKDEIISAIGMPNSFSVVNDGKELLQWQRPGYHIALLFSEGICEGATHEFRSY